MSSLVLVLIWCALQVLDRGQPGPGGGWEHNHNWENSCVMLTAVSIF